LHFNETSGTEPAPHERQNLRAGEQAAASFSVPNLVPKGSVRTHF
jgi:hypothetical protein